MIQIETNKANYVGKIGLYLVYKVFSYEALISINRSSSLKTLKKTIKK